MPRMSKQAIIDQLTEQLSTAHSNIATLRRRLSEAESAARRNQTTRREAMEKARAEARASGRIVVVQRH